MERCYSRRIRTRLKQFTVTLDFLPPAALRGNSRAHWKAKLSPTKEMRQSGFWHGLTEGIGFNVQRAKAEVVFRHYRKIDFDNFLIGLKPWWDGLIQAECIPNDDPEHFSIASVRWEKAPKGDSQTIITVTEVARES